MFEQLFTSLRVLAVSILLTGVAYPLVVTGVARILFPDQADGSLIRRGDHVIGSRLIGQAFSSPAYFHPRPSAAGNGYDAADSGATNMAPSDPRLVADIGRRARRAQQLNGRSDPVPLDLVTTSASGLDPDISPAAARYQAARVARARGLSEAQVVNLVEQHVKGRTLELLGEPRVNVLELNLALDGLGKQGDGDH